LIGRRTTGPTGAAANPERLTARQRPGDNADVSGGNGASDMIAENIGDVSHGAKNPGSESQIQALYFRTGID
jgi:hypothetical protein